MDGFENYIELISQLTGAERVIFYGFLSVLLLRMFFDIFVNGKLIFSKDLRIRNSKPSFSVFMKIRNEEDNLKTNLPVLLNNTYLNYEIVVVDDFSQDQSYTILGIFRSKYKNITISSLNQDIRNSSKQATNIGMKAAKNEWVIQTRPSVSEYSEQWISSFADKIGKNINLVVAYSNVLPKPGIYNTLYRLELLFQQLQSFAFIGFGAGFVVEEDNIAFHRQKYFEIGGFARELDDEYLNLERLFNKFIRKKSTAFNLSSEGNIFKNREVNFQKYKELILKSIHIKKRLAFYKKVLLFLNQLSVFLVLPMVIAMLVFLPGLFFITGMILLAKVILHLLVLYFVLNSLNEKKLFIPSLIYELIFPFYRLSYVRNYFGSLRKRRWNSK